MCPTQPAASPHERNSSGFNLCSSRDYAVLRALLAQPSLGMQSFQRRCSSITELLEDSATKKQKRKQRWKKQGADRTFCCNICPLGCSYQREGFPSSPSTTREREREVVPKGNRYTDTAQPQKANHIPTRPSEHTRHMHFSSSSPTLQLAVLKNREGTAG
jgi:hypothetical protein